MIDQLKPLLGKLALFSQERMGFKHPPKLFLRNDSQNSHQALGKTAFYNPEKRSVTLFIHGRHPKDILRSFAHELVHHCQNERGDLSPDKITASGANYAQECPHMRKMEKEAYLKGNMCFRDWEDTIEGKDKILIKLAESRFLKENKTMTKKITKEFLKQTIREILNENNKQSLEEVELEEMGCGGKGLRDKEDIEEEVENLEEAKCCGRDKCEHPRDDHLIKETEELEEGKKCPHCDGDAPRSECICGEIKENEELEEAVPTVDRSELDDDDVVDGPGDMSVKDGKLVKVKEGTKIQTPEQENTLYEQRFAPKNNRLFEKLVKEWTK